MLSSYDAIRFYKLDSERRKRIIRRLKEDIAREEKISSQ